MRHPLRGVACVFQLVLINFLSFRNVVRNLSVTMYSTLDFKVKYKNLSPPLFIEEVAQAKRSDGGVKTPTTVVAGRRVCPANTSNAIPGEHIGSPLRASMRSTKYLHSTLNFKF